MQGLNDLMVNFYTIALPVISLGISAPSFLVLMEDLGITYELMCVSLFPNYCMAFNRVAVSRWLIPAPLVLSSP
jgi:hypothetical protein